MLDISDIRFCGISGFVKFLEAEQVSILLFHQFQHRQPVVRASQFFRSEFIPAPYIPGHNSYAGGILMGKIMTGQAESKKGMNILPADQQAYQ